MPRYTVALTGEQQRILEIALRATAPYGEQLIRTFYQVEAVEIVRTSPRQPIGFVGPLGEGIDA